MSGSLSSIRRGAAVALQRLRLARLDGVPRFSGRPMVAGLFSTPSGIGAGARRIFDALEAAGLEPAAFDLSWAVAPNQPRTPVDPHYLKRDDDGAGPVIVHVNAPEVPAALAAIGRPRLSDRLRIAYWAWEFETVPRDWPRELRYFHECWAPSRFTAAAIAGAAPGTPVRSVGYAITAPEPDPVAVEAWRRRLAPGGETLVYYAFDLRSSISRKNPEAAVAAFAAAFRDEDARLALKVSGLGWRADLDAWALGLAASDRRVSLLDEKLSDAEMDALVAAIDICISPHRSEGFGFTPARALTLGADVVMTGWSGNMDYADLDGVHCINISLVPAHDRSGVYADATGRWAEPDIDHAAELLRDAAALRAKEGHTRRKRIAEAATNRFSASAFMSRTGEVFSRHAGGLRRD